MELVRIPREEQLYERKAIFGRDVSSVFPMEAQKAKQEHMKQLSEAVGLGEGRFITEKQLEELKKTRGSIVEDGSVVRDKTLAAILAENKEKKEEEFQNVWKSMKQGKNRPLDEDDLAFVTGWQDSEHAKEQSLKIAERDEVASFQEAVRKAAEARNQTGGNAAEESPEEDRPRPQEARRPLIKVKRGAVVTKRKNEPIRAGDPIKRTREVEPPDSGNANVLAGLLDGYESGSDCNESESKS